MLKREPGSASPYDAFAGFYDKHWGTEVATDFLRAAERLLLKHVLPGAHLLDLCCGTGHLAAVLTARGFRVTGLDSSAGMLRHARRNAPDAKFILADVTNFRLRNSVAGALSLFDSFNHLLTAEDFTAALGCVYTALAPGARFVFDLNTEAGFLEHLHEHHTVVEHDSVLALRGEYDAHSRLAIHDGTLFDKRKAGCWRRTDFRITERCYEKHEVCELLASAGFSSVRIYDAARDVGLIDHTGRVFFVARKPLRKSARA